MATKYVLLISWKFFSQFQIPYKTRGKSLLLRKTSRNNHAPFSDASSFLHRPTTADLLSRKAHHKLFPPSPAPTPRAQRRQVLRPPRGRYTPRRRRGSAARVVVSPSSISYPQYRCPSAWNWLSSWHSERCPTT